MQSGFLILHRTCHGVQGTECVELMGVLQAGQLGVLHEELRVFYYNVYHIVGKLLWGLHFGEILLEGSEVYVAHF